MLFAMVACSFAGIILFALQLDKTFGFRDEAFYALSMEQPHNGLFKVIDHNVYLHIIYFLLSESLYSIRLFWFILQIISGIVAGASLCFMLRSIGYRINKINMWTIITSIATATCSYYSTRYFTPSYNSWNLVWILTCLSSLFLYSSVSFKSNDQVNLKFRYLTIVCISLSGSMIFLGKPTSAFGIAIVATCWMLLMPNNLRPSCRLFDIAMAALLSIFILILHFEFVSEGIGVNYQKYKIGLDYLEKGGIHTFENLLKKYYNIFSFRSISLSSVAAMSGCFFLSAVIYRYSYQRIYILSLSFVLYCIALSMGVHFIAFKGKYILGHLSIWILLSALFAWVLMNGKSTHEKKLISLIFILLFIAALSYEFGSGNYPAVHLTSGFSLTALTSMSILATTDSAYRSSVITFGGLCLILFSLSSLLPTFRAPQEVNVPLSLHSYEVSLREGTRPIKLTQDQQNFLYNVEDEALSDGWKTGTPIINLINTFTAVPYFLKAHQLVSNWAFRPKHIDKETLIKLYNKISTDELKNAWVLFSSNPSDKRFFNSGTLRNIGLDFPELYKPVYIDKYIQLWKPVSITQKCIR